MIATPYSYDIAVSFAGENRSLARALVDRFRTIGYTVFFDERAEESLWGTNGRAEFARVFGEEARYCLVLISRGYDENAWTVFEREVMESRELGDKSNFLLPVMTDDHRPAWLPKTRIYFDLVDRSFDELVSLVSRRVPFADAPRQLAPTPSLRWVAPAGIGTWKSRPVVSGSSVIIPTAGSVWNAPDAADGVVALDRATGERRWHAHTIGDANATLVTEDRVYVGTDGGRVHAIDAATGMVLWTHRTRGAVLARPLPTPLGVLVCDTQGTVAELDHGTGRVLGTITIGSGVVADPVPLGDIAYIATVTGMIYEVAVGAPGDMEPADLAPNGLRSAALDYPSIYEQSGHAPCSFHGTPVVWGSLLVLPYVRYTSFPGVPVTAFDTASFEQIWRSVHSDDPTAQYGNVRSTPLIVRDTLVAPVAYGNEIVGVDRSGSVIWKGPAGRSYFPQWGSPAPHGDDALVPRYDGFLHAVSALTGARSWSMYLGGEEGAGRYFGPREALPGESVYPEWENVESAPLNAPATVADDAIYVVSADGNAYCVDLA